MLIKKSLFSWNWPWQGSWDNTLQFSTELFDIHQLVSHILVHDMIKTLPFWLYITHHLTSSFQEHFCSQKASQWPICGRRCFSSTITIEDHFITGSDVMLNFRKVFFLEVGVGFEFECGRGKSQWFSEWQPNHS